MGQNKISTGLGFRQLEDFNMALLAKQGWKMLKDPNSIFARNFLKKYFRNSKLHEGSLGKSNSFLWRSVWSALGLLRRGLLWMEGNGESIKIWLQE